MNQDQRWTRAVMERDSWMCQNCGTATRLIHPQQDLQLG
jgi:hypothetical protein